MSRLPLADQPQETRFFLLIAGWAGALGVDLLVCQLRGGGDRPAGRPGAGDGHPVGVADPFAAASAAAGRGRRTRGRGTRIVRRRTEAVDRPFLDEEGRLPAPTLAPFAVGLGVALAALGPVFGLAPVAVGAVSFLWGAGTWFAASREEFDAQKRDG